MAKYKISADIAAHYRRGIEEDRLIRAEGRLELLRTQEIIERHLPPAPAMILDVGGGPGVYSAWLAERGYEVHLIDPVGLHLDQARQRNRSLSQRISSISHGDARELPFRDESAAAVLLMGPLYHLTEVEDRILAWEEARRVLKPGGVVFAAAISRFASALDGLRSNYLEDPHFEEIALRDLLDGQHRNPGDDPRYFSTAYFHRPEDLEIETLEAGLQIEETVGVEGPGWLLADLVERMKDESRRESVLKVARWLESDPQSVALSAHLLCVAFKPEGESPVPSLRRRS